METISQASTEVEYEKGRTDANVYRDAVKKTIEAEVKNTLDEELRKAAEELLEEQRKAIRHMLEEHRKVIREAVEDEKKAIWKRVEELRKSISQLGIG